MTIEHNNQQQQQQYPHTQQSHHGSYESLISDKSQHHSMIDNIGLVVVEISPTNMKNSKNNQQKQSPPPTSHIIMTNQQDDNNEDDDGNHNNNDHLHHNTFMSSTYTTDSNISCFDFYDDNNNIQRDATEGEVSDCRHSYPLFLIINSSFLIFIWVNIFLNASFSCNSLKPGVLGLLTFTTK